MKANTVTQLMVAAGVAMAATAIWVGATQEPETEIIREVIYLPAPTTTSTSTTTTTTTTTIPIPVEQAKVVPAKSALAAKIDEWSPGTSSQVSATALKAGGLMACNMWEAGPTSRMSVMREVAAVMNLTSDQMNIAALVAQAVLYTGCRAYANFPEGPLPFDCMGNGKICD
jgi:hypothetical protein